MESKYLYPLSYFSLQTYHDFAKAEIYVLLKSQNYKRVTTLEYYERDPEEALTSCLNEVSWNVPVSPESTLIASTSGKRRDYLNIYWFALHEKNQLGAFSMYLNKPIVAPLQLNDILLPSPVVTNDQKLNIFILRSGQLWHYSFAGISDAEAYFQTKKLVDFQGKPALGTAVPVPESEKNGIVFCWTASTAEGMYIYHALLENNKLKVVQSGILEDVVPMEKSKADIHVPEEGPITFGFVAKGSDYCQMITSVCDFDAIECSVNSGEIDISFNEISASATFFLKHPRSSHYYTYLLSNEKSLYKYRDEELEKIREDVDLTYNFPIVTTLTIPYEIRMNEKGEIELNSI
jgi:hypothetical protein